ncbi:glycoside hydrolase family 65 protein [candidate division KSB1 bacterium]|nr:glycoside hydrolase family 65 protein [candidate division KSB1 bacterium]
MNSWKIIYDDWKPELEPLREALCALGNGYFVTRGAAEESSNDGTHYPGTFLAGGYNRAKSHISGKIIENEDLVNFPNWLYMNFRINDDEWFRLEKVEILDYQQELDLYHGVLSRDITFKDKKGRKTHLACKRFVSMENPHLAAIQWQFTPLDWSGTLWVHSALDGNIKNQGVDRYKDLNSEHLEPLQSGQEGENGIFLLVQTGQSHIQMAQAARTTLPNGIEKEPVSRETISKQGYIAQELMLKCDPDKSVQIEKLVSLYTSRDNAISEPVLEARKTISRAKSFEEELDEHQKAWKALWQRADIVIQDDRESQQILRLHIFHLLQTVSPHTIDLDVGVPSRGWHGEAYRGHIFWDELYIFPFLNLRIPEISRSLLMYRYRRLEEARFAAAEAGYKGAMYPWQSGSNGREESQDIHLNPKSGEWDPDITHLQRHINAAIVYNIWGYYQSTCDKEFLYFYGAEMILEIAKFWASIAELNPERNRFEIKGVVGPDEFHTKYPDRDQGGLDNNAYTNFMAAWVLQLALKLLEILDDERGKELLQQLEIRPEELHRWKEISEKMYLPINKNNIIEQFEGYEQLEELDWQKYKKKYGDVQRMDRILKAEGESTNRYKVGKQADVLMIFYLFSSKEIERVFNTLNYDFDPQMIPKNINYYKQHSSHGSTLSRLVYSWVLARSNRKESWYLFKEALMSDYKDIQGGTTPEGIHLGSMAGTVDMIQRCYTAIELHQDVLWLNPILPEELGCIRLRIRYRGHWINIETDQQKLKIQLAKGWSQKVRIGVKEKIYSFEQGETREIDLTEGK